MKQQLHKNDKAEEMIIVGILMNNQNYHIASEYISKDDFYNTNMSDLYSIIESEITSGNSIDFISAQTLNIVPKERLAEMFAQDNYLLKTDIVSACKALQTESIRRKASEIAIGINSDLKKGLNVNDTVDKYQREFEKIDNVNSTDKLLKPNNLGIVLYNGYRGLCDRKKNFPRSGFEKFDHYYGGFIPSEYSIIAARTSIGKSALMISIANNISNFGQGVAILTTEMTPLQILIRLASIEASIPLSNITRYDNDSNVDSDLYNYCQSLETKNIFIEELRDANEITVYRKIKSLKDKYNISVFFIDLVDKIRCSEKKQTRQLELKQISNKLFAATRAFDVHVSALVQLSREADKNLNSSPQLHHLKEAGDWEQDADLVMLIERPEKYGFSTFSDKTDCIGKARINIAKARNADIGYFDVNFIKERGLFQDIQKTREAV